MGMGSCRIELASRYENGRPHAPGRSRQEALRIPCHLPLKVTGARATRSCPWPVFVTACGAGEGPWLLGVGDVGDEVGELGAAGQRGAQVGRQSAVGGVGGDGQGCVDGA